MSGTPPAAEAPAPEPAPPDRFGVLAPTAGVDLAPRTEDCPLAGEAGRLLWDSPLPCVVQDDAGILLDVNAAFCSYVGQSAEAVLGRDIADLMPLDERAFLLGARDARMAALRQGHAVVSVDRRLLTPSGVERWFRGSTSMVEPRADGLERFLTVLHDRTPEVEIRQQAERSATELSQWFDVVPVGLMVFDESGGVISSNAAFDALAGAAPVSLSEAPPWVQALVGWDNGRLDAALTGAATGTPDAHWSREADVRGDDGRVRRLASRVRPSERRPGGALRFLAVVEDRSAAVERDLAQLEVGALMSAAGMGVATYEPSRGWRQAEAPRGSLPLSMDASGAGGPVPESPAEGLQQITRDRVAPGSRGEFERLQRALKGGEAAEVRYAVRMADDSLRWLLTRVTPAPPGASAQARTVVTLDVTTQTLAQQRNVALMRELTSTLEGSPAGIAYLREGVLQRCNRRFERMLGFAPGALQGQPFDALFRHRGAGSAALQQAQQAVAEGRALDAEIDAGSPLGEPLWYALSLRRAEPAHAGAEMVAVLTDVSHLKQQQAALQTLLHERDVMFSLADVGIVWLRGELIERASEPMAALTDWGTAQLQGMPLARLFDSEEDYQSYLLAADEAIRRNGRYEGQHPLRRRDGSRRWMQLALRPVDPAQPAAGRVGSFVDIDERHRAREALEHQVERTRAVLDVVLVGIVTVGEQGIVWMNRSARRMFGGSLEDFAGQPIGTVATEEPGHPLRRSDWLHRLADTEGGSERFECRLKARDGREFWVVGNASTVVRGPRGEREVTFALLDIELRRQAEMRIAQAQAALQRVMEAAPLAMAVFDAASHRIVRHNRGAAVFFGQPESALAGAHVQQLMAGEGAEVLGATLRLAAEGGEVLRREITRSAGSEGPAAQDLRRWDTRFVALMPEGPVHAPGLGQVLMVASDVTEQRVAEQQRFEEAVAQREMLVKEVHHRIKNNLQGVAGLLQQAASRRPDVAAELTEAVTQVQTIAQVYGLQVGTRGPVELAPMAAAVADSLGGTFGRRIDFSQAPRAAGAPAEGWWLKEADAIPVALTLNELLTNAIRHGTPDGPIGVRLHDDADAVRLVLRNRGRLREGFDPQRSPVGSYGLGLVRALLPRRHATLDFAQVGDEVVVTVRLWPPGVQRGLGEAAADAAVGRDASHGAAAINDNPPIPG